MKKLNIFLGIFLALAMSRFIPHPPNFTSLIALGFYVPLILGFKFIPALLFCFIITDFVIGFHSTILFTWGSLIVIGLTSSYFNKGIFRKKNYFFVLGGSFFFNKNFMLPS